MASPKSFRNCDVAHRLGRGLFTHEKERQNLSRDSLREAERDSLTCLRVFNNSRPITDQKLTR
jgi:hypothetical protein